MPVPDRQQFSNFLSAEWRLGAVLGTESDMPSLANGPIEMTGNDIDNGRVNMEFGIAPLKPAESVIFCVEQNETAFTFPDPRGTGAVAFYNSADSLTAGNP